VAILFFVFVVQLSARRTSPTRRTARREEKVAASALFSANHAGEEPTGVEENYFLSLGETKKRENPEANSESSSSSSSFGMCVINGLLRPWASEGESGEEEKGVGSRLK